MNNNKSLYFPILTIWASLAVAVLVLAHFYPPTHFGYNYYGIAYDMWEKGSFWYPTWLDTINVQKPPLFYWLTQLCWKVFGLHHIFMPIIILICYLLTAIYAAKATWIISKNKNATKIAGMLVLVNLTLFQYIGLIRFDIQLTFCATLTFYALCQILYEEKFSYWWLFAFGNLLGLLFKGPVIFLFTLPAALCGPLLHPIKYSKIRYFSNTLLVSLLSIAASLVWLIPADRHSHGVYQHTFLTQTWQRFNHQVPDPNLPNIIVNNYHWWYAFKNIFSYFGSAVILPFILVLPIFGLRLYRGIKQPENRLVIIYFAIVTLIPIVIFGAFIGLVRYRYLLPVIPLVCIFIAKIFTSVSLDAQTQITESRIFRGYLWLLIILIAGLIVGMVFPALRNNMTLFLKLVTIFLLITIFSWHAKNWRQRWHSLIVSTIVYAYLFLFANIILLAPFMTINTTAKKLQQLSAQHLPLYEINNDLTRTGWTQYLARDLTIRSFTQKQFDTFNKTTHQTPSWIIYYYPLFKTKRFSDKIYPLQYSIDQNQSVPILVPYKIFVKLRA